MPSEIFEMEKFVSMSAHAEYCLVKRSKDGVKLKLRTSGNMFTFKVPVAKADEIIKKLQCEIQEF